LNLGEKCDPQVYNQCPINSFCSEKKICDCYCGYVKLGDDACAPQPSCPAVEAPTRLNFLDVIKVSKLTLCRIPDGPKPSLSSVVDKCPKGEYCSSYVSEYGLCCPIPEKPFCPNGAKAGEKCDPKATNPCGFTGFCSRYFNPLGNDSDGYVCCPLVSIPLPAFNISGGFADMSP